MLKWMLFVDGENLTIRAQQKVERENLTLVDGPYFKRDCFLWMPYPHPLQRPHCITGEIENLEQRGLRAYYYASVVGDEDMLTNVKESLWRLGFTPKVFKKQRDRKSKGVDISLTTDMLTHAFQNHFDVAILMAGDADYEALVGRVKSLGKLLWLWFFQSSEDGLSPLLRRSSDVMLPLDALFATNWPKQP
jgi:uncharacterized LabA/DUF88 family protein